MAYQNSQCEMMRVRVLDCGFTCGLVALGGRPTNMRFRIFLFLYVAPHHHPLGTPGPGPWPLSFPCGMSQEPLIN